METAPSPIFGTDTMAPFSNALFSLFQDFQISLGSGKVDLDSEEGFKKALNSINLYLPKIYTAYDAFLAHWISESKTVPVCGKNCGNCCSHYVSSVEPVELIFITHRWIQKEGYSRLLSQIYQRVQKYHQGQSEKTSDEDKMLFHYLKKEIPCPFLSKDGACRTYNSRPMPCRMFYSLSHPSLCLADGTISRENRNFIIELPMEIEIQIAQIGHKFSKYRISDHLFEGLLQINELVGKYYT